MSAAIDQLPDTAYEFGKLRAEFRVSRGDAIIMAMFASFGAIVIAPYAFLRIAPA